MIDDHPHKMTKNEAAVHEALVAGRIDEAQVYATMHQAERLDYIGNCLGTMMRVRRHATDFVADRDTRGVTLVRMMPNSPTWQATWRCGGRRTTSEFGNRWDALRWASNEPAGVRLVLNPDTNEWETFNAEAIRHGHEAIGEDYM